MKQGLCQCCWIVPQLIPTKWPINKSTYTTNLSEISLANQLKIQQYHVNKLAPVLSVDGDPWITWRQASIH